MRKQFRSASISASWLRATRLRIEGDEGALTMDSHEKRPLMISRGWIQAAVLFLMFLFCNQQYTVVEAAGVEPASENVTGQETTCLVEFMLPAFTGNVRDPGSEPTRNQFR